MQYTTRIPRHTQSGRFGSIRDVRAELLSLYDDNPTPVAGGRSFTGHTPSDCLPIVPVCIMAIATSIFNTRVNARGNKWAGDSGSGGLRYIVAWRSCWAIHPDRPWLAASFVGVLRYRTGPWVPDWVPSQSIRVLGIPYVVGVCPAPSLLRPSLISTLSIFFCWCRIQSFGQCRGVNKRADFVCVHFWDVENEKSAHGA